MYICKIHIHVRIRSIIESLAPGCKHSTLSYISHIHTESGTSFVAPKKISSTHHHRVLHTHRITLFFMEFFVALHSNIIWKCMITRIALTYRESCRVRRHISRLYSQLVSLVSLICCCCRLLSLCAGRSVALYIYRKSG